MCQACWGSGESRKEKRCLWSQQADSKWKSLRVFPRRGWTLPSGPPPHSLSTYSYPLGAFSGEPRLIQCYQTSCPVISAGAWSGPSSPATALWAFACGPSPGPGVAGTRSRHTRTPRPPSRVNGTHPRSAVAASPRPRSGGKAVFSGKPSPASDLLRPMALGFTWGAVGYFTPLSLPL